MIGFRFTPPGDFGKCAFDRTGRVFELEWRHRTLPGADIDQSRQPELAAVGASTSANNLLISPSNAAAFYRILGQ